MSQGDDVAEKSADPEKPWLTDPELTPRVISVEGRVPRFIGKTKLSPYIVIDGKVMRSSLNLTKKEKDRRVRFPDDETLSRKCEDAVDEREWASVGGFLASSPRLEEDFWVLVLCPS